MQTTVQSQEELAHGYQPPSTAPESRAIHVQNLYKSYGHARVLNGVNLDVNQGEFYALMGPNGSGKSTLATIIASVIGYDSGVVELLGKSPDHARKIIGYVPQENFSVPTLTCSENLRYFAGLLGYSRKNARNMAQDLLGKIGLAADADKRASQLSGGMRKRLEVATALFPGTRILILDEPTTGLDPVARHEFFQLIKNVVDKGTSILLITHIGTDAEVADMVGLMHKGKIVAEGSPETLKRTYATVDVITIETNIRNQQVASILASYSTEGKLAETSDGYHLYTRDGSEAVPNVIHALDKAGIREKRIELSTASLEDVFFRLTEHPMQEATPQ